MWKMEGDSSSSLIRRVWTLLGGNADNSRRVAEGRGTEEVRGH